MQSPAPLDNELERTKALQRLGLMYTPAEERYDRITRLAARHFKVPTVLFSLVYKDVQWFKSVYGLNACSTGRDVSFCGHAIAQIGPFVIENALLDPRFSDNPLVIHEPKVRAYAGQPVRDQSGTVLGTFCLVDVVPRQFDADDLQDLRDFAKLIEGEVARPQHPHKAQRYMLGLEDEQRMTLIDPVLACWNKKGIITLLELEQQQCQEVAIPLGWLTVNMEAFGTIETRFGVGRAVDFERFSASLIREHLADNWHLGFLGTGRFVLVCPGADSDAVSGLKKQLELEFARTELESKDVKALVGMSITCGNLEAKEFRKPARAVFETLIKPN